MAPRPRLASLVAMLWHTLSNWLSTAPVLAPSAIVLGLMVVAAAGGRYWRLRFLSRDAEAHAAEDDTYIMSAVLGLLALLMGFTFSLAVDRFELRRALVLDEANAIETTYLRAQLLQEPHRARFGQTLTAYAENRLALASARPEQIPALKVRNEDLVTELWADTVAAFPTIQGLDFSSAFLDSVNQVTELEAARRAESHVRVPVTVFVVLFIYMIVSAAILGKVLIGRQAQSSAIMLAILLNLSLALIIDIDRPSRGGANVPQAPLEDLVRTLQTRDPATFDRFEGTPPQVGALPPAGRVAG